MKKLIYILNSYSEKDSSHFTHILHLLEVMAEQGCSIVLLVEKLDSMPSLNGANIRVVGLKTRFPFFRHIELFAIISSLIREGYKKSFIRIAAPAAIVASLAHRLYGGESYLWQSGTTYEHDWAQPLSARKIKWWLTSFVPNWLARKLVRYFVTGPEAMVDYYAEVVGLPREKIILLYNDIQIERFSRTTQVGAREKFLREKGLADDAVVLLLVHRLSPVRRTLMYLDPLLRGLARKSHELKWTFVIAGGGSELEAAKSLVAHHSLSDRVIFLGNVPNREVPALYAAADIFIHPTFTEGFPRVLIEAMATGLPIVSTDAGGTRQLMGQRQMSYVVDKSQPDEFAAKSVELLEKSCQWDALAAENVEIVKRFSTPNVARMYMRALFS